MKILFVGLLSLLALLVGTNLWSKQVRTIDLNPENTVVLRGEINSDSVSKAIVNMYAAPGPDVYLFIDSGGGSVLDGLRLINAIDASPHKVHCIASVAASMAFIILQACPDRLIVNNALLMQHVASYGVEGREPNNYEFAMLMRKISNDLNERQAKRIGMSLDEFNKKTMADWWLWDSEAIKVNAADEKVKVTCTKDLVDKRIIESFTFLIFKVEIVFSGCPLISEPLSIDMPQDTINDADAKIQIDKKLKTYRTDWVFEKYLQREK
jgi:ATP-dependent protease ClpP protease subunit